jgi:hypothetical protein
MKRSALSLLSRLPYRVRRTRRFFCMLLPLCTTSLAEEGTGAIAGTVKNSSGAVVADVKLNITDVDLGTSRSRQLAEFSGAVLFLRVWG